MTREEFAEYIRRERSSDPPKPWRQIAKELGVCHQGVIRRAQRLKSIGLDIPEVVPSDPEHYRIERKSELFKLGEDGSKTPLLIWEKSASTTGLEERVKALVESMILEVRGIEPPVKPPLWVSEDHLNIVPYGDPHVGMYAWAKEAGDDFDLDIAERLMTGAMAEVIARAPPAREGWLINLGDFFHADDQSNSTPASKHALDVDSRWPKIQAAGARIMRKLIRMMLERHESVVVKCVRGNHDPHSGYSLALILDAVFENEHRVDVCLDPGPFWYRMWGNTLFGVCHGHTVRKLADLPLIMACDRPAEWGAARHRRWLVGHYHHSRKEDHNGCSVEIFRTLAPADAWTHGKGYRSERSLDLITVHRTMGERARATVFFDQVEKSA